MNAATRPGGRHQILIVDDDQATLSGLKELFERSGFDVIAAGTFAQARAVLAKASPDLLITDVRLGEFNGLHLVVTNPRSIPTIIMTGHPDPVLEADAHRFGADYLLKPISLSALRDLVTRKLARDGEPLNAFTPARRWTRKRVTGELPARVGNWSAMILDISYGGLRFEVERHPWPPLPRSLNILLPLSSMSVPVDLVWTTRGADESSICGASIAAGDEGAALAWHGLVDALVGLSTNFT